MTNRSFKPSLLGVKAFGIEILASSHSSLMFTRAGAEHPSSVLAVRTYVRLSLVVHTGKEQSLQLRYFAGDQFH